MQPSPHDNAKLHTIQKKYVLLREFARQNKEWADKADLIEYLYTDEAEHHEEIQRLWENSTSDWNAEKRNL